MNWIFLIISIIIIFILYRIFVCLNVKIYYFLIIYIFYFIIVLLCLIWFIHHFLSHALQSKTLNVLIYTPLQVKFPSRTALSSNLRFSQPNGLLRCLKECSALKNLFCCLLIYCTILHGAKAVISLLFSLASRTAFVSPRIHYSWSDWLIGKWFKRGLNRHEM